MCVELICCVINSSYSLKVTLECFMDGIYNKLTIHSSVNSNYRYVASVFFKFGEVIVEYFVYKRVFGFPPFCFSYLFMKLFLFQSKTKNVVKDVNQDFTSNNLNKKNSEHTFVKKLLCEHLTL